MRITYVVIWHMLSGVILWRTLDEPEEFQSVWAERVQMQNCNSDLFFSSFDDVEKSHAKCSDSNYQVENCLKYLHEV